MGMDVEAKSDFAFCVDFKHIMDVVKNCPEQPLTLGFDDQEKRLRIVGDNFEISLNAYDQGEFPKTPEEIKRIGDTENKTGFAVSGKQKEELFSYLKKSLPFVSRDDLRPSMTGVLLHSKEGKLTIAATDASRLYFKTTDIRYTGEPVILAASAVKAILLLFARSDDFDFKQSAGVRTMSTDGYTKLFARTIDARYPDYETVLASAIKNADKKFVMIAKDMKRMIKLANPFAERHLRTLKLTADAHNLTYEAEDVDYGKKAKVTSFVYESDIQGKIEFGLNGNMTLEILNIFNDDYIKINVSETAHKAIIINDCVLLMPVMLNNY